MLLFFSSLKTPSKKMGPEGKCQEQQLWTGPSNVGLPLLLLFGEQPRRRGPKTHSRVLVWSPLWDQGPLRVQGPLGLQGPLRVQGIQGPLRVQGPLWDQGPLLVAILEGRLNHLHHRLWRSLTQGLALKATWWGPKATWWGPKATWWGPRATWGASTRGLRTLGHRTALDTLSPFSRERSLCP